MELSHEDKVRGAKDVYLDLDMDCVVYLIISMEEIEIGINQSIMPEGMKDFEMKIQMDVTARTTSVKVK